jgi:hypothetical protein
MVGNLQSNLQYYCFLAFACFCWHGVMCIREIEIHFAFLRFRFVGVLMRCDADGRQRSYGEILCSRAP